MLLGSTSIKAVHSTLVKLTPAELNRAALYAVIAEMYAHFITIKF
jgi:hypothetical protein